MIKWVRPENLISQHTVDLLECDDGTPRWPDAIKVIEYTKYLELERKIKKLEHDLWYAEHKARYK